MMRSALWAAFVSVVAFSISGCKPSSKGDPSAKIEFKRDGSAVTTLSLAELEAAAPPETWTAYDPYYSRPKTFRALPLEKVLTRAFGAASLNEQHFVLRAKDGYTVPINGARLLEPGAYIAVADAEVPGWEAIGPQRANPGPFYLVWKNDGQQDLETHPRPWQLAAIEITPFEKVFPHTVPMGATEGSPSMRGYAIFREQCIRCHAINREGGRTGPDLNVPLSVVEYRPGEQIRAYIRDPRSFRYGNMPAHPGLNDADLDGLLAYFTTMKDHKHDPDAGKVGH